MRTQYLLILSLLILATPVAADTYSIFHLSDTQTLSESYPSVLNTTFSSLESMKSTYNIKEIIVTGDLVDNYNVASQWKNYLNAKKKTTIPVYEVAGNHDNNYASTWTYYNSYIGSSKEFYTKVFDNFVFIGISYNKSPISSTTWNLFKSTIAANPSKIPIIATHYYMDGSGSYSAVGKAIQKSLISRYSIVMCGHVHTVKEQTKTYNGYRVTEDLFDMQTSGKYSEGNLYTITTTNGKVTKIITRHVELYPTKRIESPVTIYSG